MKLSFLFFCQKVQYIFRSRLDATAESTSTESPWPRLEARRRSQPFGPTIRRTATCAGSKWKGAWQRQRPRSQDFSSSGGKTFGINLLILCIYIPVYLLILIYNMKNQNSRLTASKIFIPQQKPTCVSMPRCKSLNFAATFLAFWELYTIIVIMTNSQNRKFILQPVASSAQVQHPAASLFDPDEAEDSDMLEAGEGLTSQAEEEEKRRKKNCATFQVLLTTLLTISSDKLC